MMLDVDKLSMDYVEDSSRFVVEMQANFIKMGGVTADKKLTIDGHKIPCKCGRAGRRYVPNGRPVCRKCWNDAIKEGLHRIMISYMLKATVECLFESLGEYNEDKKEHQDD